MQDAGTEEQHQDLVVCDASTFIHRVDAVDKPNDLLLIEEWDGGECSTAKCVFDKHAELALTVEDGGRAEERVLLAAVDGVGYDVADCFAEDELLSHAVDLLADRKRAYGFNDAVIEEGNTA